MNVSVDHVAKIGGLLMVFVFIHFVADWVFQSHDEAMSKHSNWKVRAMHCCTYIGFFIVPIFLLSTPTICLVSVAVLFVSHFIEDTYVPVIIWATYFRRHPDLRTNIINGTVVPDVEGFKKFISTPLGTLLMVVIDQIIHIAFLFVPIVLILRSKP